MSIIAGIYCRHENKIIPNHICEELKKLISRQADEDIIVFKNDRTFFAKVDVGTFTGVGFFEDSAGGITLVAGEPILTNLQFQSREKDLVQIHEGLNQSNFDSLKTANGVFCAVSSQNGILTLIADKLGIRPLYYWISEDYVIFATALRLLENLSVIPKQMNVRAVTEIAGLGYPLSNRTPYENIFVLKSAEIVQIKNNEISSLKYWSWDTVRISDESEEHLLSTLYERFNASVTRRLNEDKTTISYLSGGLDSRCIVGALINAKVQIHTFNFARPNTQDQILGRYFAAKANVIHNEVPKESGDHVPDYSMKMVEAWKNSSNRQTFPVERPNLIWSGEGGSVALGHVHLNQKIVDLMRSGKIDEAINEYIQREHIYLSSKLLQKKIFGELSALLKKGIKEELELLNHQDSARNFYLFLLQNDQRRKLHGHFENTDLHRLEFQLPFFDSSVLETIISIPLDLCLRHQFYVKWLYLFPDFVTSVSWQAYPGHEPCPLPIPDGLSYQWDDKYQINEQKSLNRKLINQAKELLNAPDFPSDILSRNNIRLAVFLHRTGWRDYSYIIENAKTYYKYWKICQGNYHL